jgi:hypothetical protein
MRRRPGAPARRKNARQPRIRAFVQILGKLYFFELIENLSGILVDYAQNPTKRANAAFNGAC